MNCYLTFMKELEWDHLVLRSEYLEARVEYELSSQAKKLQPILVQLIQWKMEQKLAEA